MFPWQYQKKAYTVINDCIPMETCVLVSVYIVQGEQRAYMVVTNQQLIKSLCGVFATKGEESKSV
jgi:hypothetical protein